MSIEKMGHGGQRYGQRRTRYHDVKEPRPRQKALTRPTLSKQILLFKLPV